MTTKEAEEICMKENTTQAEERAKTNKMPQTWDIYFADIPKRVGDTSYIYYGKRPILVSSNNQGNRTSPTINAYPFTSKLNKRNLPVHVNVEGFGLRCESTLACEQPMTLTKKDLLYKMGRIDDYITMLRIQHAIHVQNGLLAAIV